MPKARFRRDLRVSLVLPLLLICSTPLPAWAAPNPTVVPLKGSVTFVGKKVLGSHACEFEKHSAEITLHKGAAVGGKLEVQVQTGSVFCDRGSRKPWTQKLDKHLVSEDFFYSTKYPTASFVSSSLSALPGKASQLQVQGQLTMRGVSKKVSFPATIELGPKSIRGEASVRVNRKDFGIVYPGKPDNLIQDMVELRIKFKGSRSP